MSKQIRFCPSNHWHWKGKLLYFDHTTCLFASSHQLWSLSWFLCYRPIDYQWLSHRCAPEHKSSQADRPSKWQSKLCAPYRPISRNFVCHIGLSAEIVCAATYRSKFCVPHRPTSRNFVCRYISVKILWATCQSKSCMLHISRKFCVPHRPISRNFVCYISVEMLCALYQSKSCVPHKSKLCAPHRPISRNVVCHIDLSAEIMCAVSYHLKFCVQHSSRNYVCHTGLSVEIMCATWSYHCKFCV